jgi:hypothetical protein
VDQFKYGKNGIAGEKNKMAGESGKQIRSLGLIEIWYI